MINRFSGFNDPMLFTLNALRVNAQICLASSPPLAFIVKPMVIILLFLLRRSEATMIVTVAEITFGCETRAAWIFTRSHGYISGSR
jgi:hypothetical protein